MALIPIENVVLTVSRTLRTDADLRGIQILSYKRNRHITILRSDEAEYLVEEHGYVVETREVAAAQLTKHLKSIFKREFPRSRKLRIVKLFNDEHLTRKLKKL